MNIKRIAVVGLGVLFWASQAWASQWDDLRKDWRSKAEKLNASDIPALELKAKNCDPEAVYLLSVIESSKRFGLDEIVQRQKLHSLKLCAADAGHPLLMAAAASGFFVGSGTPVDKKQALYWYEKAADTGYAIAFEVLGSLYRDGTSIASLGAMYRDGKGVTKDTTEALKWFLKGAEFKDAYSMASLAVMYRDGTGVTKNGAEALKWFHKGVELNDAYSMSSLGDMYRDGNGVTTDEVEALKWYRKGADLKDAVSMVGLGHMYLYHKDIAQDFAEALKWFRKAAELGTYAYANTAIGELYHNGHGVLLDEVESSKWFRKAADGGDVAGMVQLARNYKLGRGVSQNINESARLYVKALGATGNAKFHDNGESGQQKARRELDAMLAGGEITEPQILREVRALSKPAPKAEWVQAPQTTSEEEVTFKVNVVDGGGGIGDVSFKLNGVALNVSQGRNATVIELANTNVRTFTFRLPPGKHDVEVIAYNAENLINWTSLKSTVTSTFKPIRKPQLHAVIVGINDYENDKLKLRFATNDATEVAKVLKTSGEKLYDQVHVKLLNTRGSTGKTAILQAIKEAASKAQTEDVFIFYVAGHGQNFGDSGYHMLTADVGVMTDKAVQASSISAQELQRAIYDVPSGKKVVLLDTCQSGGGLDANKLMSVRGGIDNLDMVKDMNRKSGAIVLAAAESKEDAMEGYQGHGVFTFALLEALQGKADTKGDGFVSTFQLQEYVSNRTYELAQQAFNGKKQSPYTSGNNGFPFLKWK